MVASARYEEPILQSNRAGAGSVGQGAAVQRPCGWKEWVHSRTREKACVAAKSMGDEEGE